ncbi:glycoside hydrolase family 16 protein [Actinomycetospora aeridis]|uniref:Glycoside hydrolase family 16 protein n=1 Tax=Actinomycetospora aeridis TaxID=3129231 RepID=A0ABU8N894_9PSEU
MYGLRILATSREFSRNRSPCAARSPRLDASDAFHHASGHRRQVEEGRDGPGGCDRSRDAERRPTWEKLGGHWEARMQLPTGQGLWPAFWTVGNGGWPMTGEIDIMENLGHQPNQVHQVLHYGPDEPSDINWGQTAPVSGGVTGFHTYAIDWNNSANGYIKWSVDGVVTRTVTAAQANARQAGLWDRIRTNPQNIIINLAVGGWPGTPPAGPMSAVMKVDYIRVYENPMN